MNRLPSPILFTALAFSVNAMAQTPSPGSAPESFTFRFQPADGTRVTTAYAMQRVRTIEGQPSVKDEVESTTEGVFKKAGSGYEFTQRTLNATMRRNGNPIEDPIAGLLAKVRPTFTVSADGAVTAIKGFDEVEKLIKSTMPPQMAAALAPVLNESALVARETGEWNARYAEFADATLKIGDVITAQAPQPLPNGETIQYTIRTAFPRWEPCPAGQCIRIEQIYESDAAVLSKLLGDVLKKVAAAASAPSQAQPIAAESANRLSGSLSRLIDPGTMRIYSERVERTLTIRMQVPGKGATPVVQQEIRTYSHSYQ